MQNQEDVDENYDPEKEAIDWGELKVKPLNLKPIKWSNGEENEDVIAKFHIKFYRWASDKWRQRGFGNIKFLKHKTHKNIRVVMRQDQTHKILANFYVYGQDLCKLEREGSKDNSWTWTCENFSESPMSVEKFCAKFENKSDLEEFKTVFETCYNENMDILATMKANPSTNPDNESPKEPSLPDAPTGSSGENAKPNLGS